MIHTCSHCGHDDEIALVRPVEGIVLNREQAVTIHFALEYTRHRAVLGERDKAHMKALAARLGEASS